MVMNMKTATWSRWHRPITAAAMVVAVLTLTGMTVPSPPEPNEAEFAAANHRAMTKMMVGMDIKCSGSIDRQFALMMIPHHEGAVDMAMAELRFGHDERLRRIAQEIIVDQQQEIAAMSAILEKP